MSNTGSLKISVENIQAVEKASIEVKGFTGIVGRSNSGKSAFIRAMYAALTNKASKSIFRYDTKESRVTLEDKEHNMLVDWRKGDGINQYEVNGTLHTKVGKEPPQEVYDFGFQPVKVNDELLEVQFARQHQYLFLLDKSGSYVADFISKITKADILTGAMKDCESEDRDTKSKIKHIDKDITKLNTDLQRFNDLDYYQDRIKALQANKTEIDQKNAVIAEIESFIVELESCTTALQKLEDLPAVEEVSFDMAELTKLAEWVTEIATLKVSYDKIKQIEGVEVAEYSFDLELLKDVEACLKLEGKVNYNLPEVPEVSIDLSALTQLNSTIAELKAAATELANVDKELKDGSDNVIRLEVTQKDVEGELGNCPMCKTEFPHEHKKTAKSDEVFV